MIPADVATWRESLLCIKVDSLSDALPILPVGNRRDFREKGGFIQVLMPDHGAIIEMIHLLFPQTAE